MWKTLLATKGVPGLSHTPVVRRVVATGLAAVLLAAVVVVYAIASPGIRQLVAFGFGPDIAVVLSLEPGLAGGRMSPRAVPFYNVLHRPALPAVLGAAALVGLAPTGLLVGALIWGLHIAVDRTLGYGLRSADGWQR